MKTQENIRDVRVKLRNIYYKGYERSLELDYSTFYLKFIDDLDYYNLITETCNKLENMLRSHCV